jgi:FkbM family methyltransferase
MTSFRAYVSDFRRFLVGKLPFTQSILLARLRRQREFGLGGLDSKIASVIDLKRGFYIEIGANDGVNQSNTLQLELFHGWRGVLIEPVPSTFSRLKKNRNTKRNHLEQAACVGFDYAKDEVEIVYSNLMSASLNLNSDIEDPIGHAKKGVGFLKGEDVNGALRIVTAPALTMTSVLKKANAPTNIDLLSLDVEGAELEVLGGIDFKLFTISWILVESRDLKRISHFLEPRGYSLHSPISDHDYLFHLENQAYSNSRSG